MNHIYPSPTIEEVHFLLEQNNLPTNDLSQMDLDHFYACIASGEVQGVIGLELYGSDGLLRSFAVER